MRSIVSQTNKDDLQLKQVQKQSALPLEDHFICEPRIQGDELLLQTCYGCYPLWECAPGFAGCSCGFSSKSITVLLRFRSPILP